MMITWLSKALFGIHTCERIAAKLHYNPPTWSVTNLLSGTLFKMDGFGFKMGYV